MITKDCRLIVSPVVVVSFCPSACLHLGLLARIFARLAIVVTLVELALLETEKSQSATDSVWRCL
jgi:uncharacterized membrane protein YphA (DoxX/SURF4 family)